MIEFIINLAIIAMIIYFISINSKKTNNTKKNSKNENSTKFFTPKKIDNSIDNSIKKTSDTIINESNKNFTTPESIYTFDTFEDEQIDEQIIESKVVDNTQLDNKTEIEKEIIANNTTQNSNDDTFNKINRTIPNKLSNNTTESSLEPLSFNKSDLVRGFIFNEIFSKPRSFYKKK